VVAGELSEAAAIDRAVQDAEAVMLSQPAVSGPGSRSGIPGADGGRYSADVLDQDAG
jgi:hypothetical protein